MWTNSQHHNVFSPEHEDRLAKKMAKLRYICKEIDVDYSNHTLMRLTLDKLNKFLYGSTPSFMEIDTTHELLDEMNLINLKYTLLAIKSVHMFIYSLLIYLIVISIPNIVAHFVLYLTNKILLGFFVVLLIEAFFNIYFSYNSDILKIFDKVTLVKYTNVFPLNYLVDLVCYIISIIKKFI